MLLQWKLIRPAVDHCLGSEVETEFIVPSGMPNPCHSQSTFSHRVCSVASPEYRTYVMFGLSNQFSVYFPISLPMSHCLLTSIYPHRLPVCYIHWYSRNHVFLHWGSKGNQRLLGEIALNVLLIGKTIPAHKCWWNPVCEQCTSQHFVQLFITLIMVFLSSLQALSIFVILMIEHPVHL